MKVVIDRNKQIGYINPDIYGHFSEHLGRGIYEGIFVGEDSQIPNTDGIRNDVIEALKEIDVPVLRWPGGCFADEYHWMDGIGPKESRKKMVNTNWGGVTEDNSFGTHEFMRLCELLGCKAYINGNLGTGTPREMSEWVEYMTGTGSSPMTELRKKNGRQEPWKVDYFAVGNESWGCGGNMRASYYADLYRHYQTFLRTYDPENPIKKICVGPGTSDTKWTKTVLETCYEDAQRAFHGFMDYITLHHYVFPDGWNNKGSATGYSDELWYKSLNKAVFMDTLIKKNEAVLDDYDPEEKIALCVDEWGGWYEVEEGTNPGFLYQQATMRDALIASATMDIFNKHCKRVKMACIAQMVNVLQAVLLTQGPDMVKTPTFYIFKMYKHHQGATAVDSYISDNEFEGPDEWKIPKVSASASVKDGVTTLTVSNLSLADASDVSVDFCGETVSKILEAKIVTADDVRAFNDFNKAEAITDKEYAGYRFDDGKLSLAMPAHSVVMLRLQ
ncbi:MAG: alpha-N-arabinofuranosidase [Lachnospiraceae bacterium]|nr:alpha-N-arabinofuranosidase [Lachnospiraceae bacterium]